MKHYFWGHKISENATEINKKLLKRDKLKKTSQSAKAPVEYASSFTETAF